MNSSKDFGKGRLRPTSIKKAYQVYKQLKRAVSTGEFYRWIKERLRTSVANFLLTCLIEPSVIIFTHDEFAGGGYSSKKEIKNLEG